MRTLIVDSYVHVSATSGEGVGRGCEIDGVDGVVVFGDGEDGFESGDMMVGEISCAWLKASYASAETSILF